MSFAPLRVSVVSWEKEEGAGAQWWGWLKETMRGRREELPGQPSQGGLRRPQVFGVRDPLVESDLTIHVGRVITGALAWSHVHWLWLPADVSDASPVDASSVDASSVEGIDHVWKGAPSVSALAEAMDQCLLLVRQGRPAHGVRHLPPILSAAECPSITIVTPTFQRKRLIEIAYHNLLATDYPLERIEWIVVEDASPSSRIATPPTPSATAPAVEDASPSSRIATPPTPSATAPAVEDASPSSRIATPPTPSATAPAVEDASPSERHQLRDSLDAFQKKVPELRIRYLPVEGRRSIGEKRNIGVAAASHEWILFMDDDDHYPVTSFRRRVAWLLKGTIQGRSRRVVACTTIAMYDLIRGTSAVNVPPGDLPLSQRISEATLAFHRSVWQERAFPEVSVAEGEGWLTGREGEVLEIPPQQIIVAFSHHGNKSSRRLPPAGPVGCFWGFPKEYLVFIHGLVGVDVSF